MIPHRSVLVFGGWMDLVVRYVEMSSRAMPSVRKHNTISLAMTREASVVWCRLPIPNPAGLGSRTRSISQLRPHGHCMMRLSVCSACNITTTENPEHWTYGEVSCKVNALLKALSLSLPRGFPAKPKEVGTSGHTRKFEARTKLLHM